MRKQWYGNGIPNIMIETKAKLVSTMLCINAMISDHMSCVFVVQHKVIKMR